jgi:hypothetical protein
LKGQLLLERVTKDYSGYFLPHNSHHLSLHQAAKMNQQAVGTFPEPHLQWFNFPNLWGIEIKNEIKNVFVSLLNHFYVKKGY